MAYSPYRGWYKLTNPNKFVRPLDETMQSTKITNDGLYIQYKSLLERKMFVYADLNPKVKHFSIEPFPIEYIKPTDNRVHRYYIDVFIEFTNGSKVFVEIKPYCETVIPPKTSNSDKYKKRLITYMINQAKWKSAKEFAKNKGCEFVVITEKELK
jgi:hypothetical protein